MAPAQVLLVIDDSNPSNVTFTATANTPSASGVTNYAGGLILSDFFSAGVTGPFSFAATSTTLTSTIPDLDSYYVSARTGSFLPLNPYNFLTLIGTGLYDGPLNFEPGTVALNGSASFDFSGSSLEALLPAAGSNGYLDINSPFNGTTIGQWSVISTPEPRSWILAIAVVVTLVGLRFRSRTN